MATPDFIFDGPEDAPLTFALAHGAGAPMDSEFMNVIAERVASDGLRVARFEFPYMVDRRKSGKKKPPNSANVLMETWQAVIDELGPRVIVGGKSMGGRLASMAAAVREENGDEAPMGVICLGYPFHAPGKSENVRIAHFENLKKTPVLICQGERDPFGTLDEVPYYGLGSNVKVMWLPDGDHSFKPRKKSGHTEEENLTAAVDAIIEFCAKL